jgi:hypothetical protein
MKGMGAHHLAMTTPLPLLSASAPPSFAVGEVVAALSHALTEGQPPGHAKRSC